MPKSCDSLKHQFENQMTMSTTVSRSIERALKHHFRYFFLADGFVCVYLVTDEQSFKDSEKLCMRIIGMVGEIRPLPLVLLGNKIDNGDERVVAQKNQNEVAWELKIMHFETSPNTREGADAVCTPAGKHSADAAFQEVIALARDKIQAVSQLVSPCCLC